MIGGWWNKSHIIIKFIWKLKDCSMLTKKRKVYQDSKHFWGNQTVVEAFTNTSFPVHIKNETSNILNFPC